MKSFFKVVLACVLSASCPMALADEPRFRIKSDYEAGVAQHERGNIKMAITFFTQGAEKGDPESMFALGTYYYFGEGVNKDYGKAKSLFENSAEKGAAGADTMLGLMYLKGEGVSPNVTRAQAHFSKASYACDAAAQNQLAHLLYSGEAGSPQRVEALAWLYIAAPKNEEAANGVAHVEQASSAEEVKAAKNRKKELEASLACSR